MKRDTGAPGKAGLGYLDSTLRGAGQVVFMNNPLSGALNFAAMFWAAYAGGATWSVAIGSVIGTLVATATAYGLPAPAADRKAGLLGFNGMLVGAAIPTFLAASPLMWGVLVFAAALSTIVALAVGNLLAPWKVGALTFPFVLTTWCVLLAAHTIPALPAVPAEAASPVLSLDAAAFLRAILASVSQIFLVDNPVSGALFLLALAVHSRWCAALAIGGATLAVLAALLVGADKTAICHGLWGYSAALTAPAIGCIFLTPSARTLVYAAFATLLTVVLQGATAVFAASVGLPALTFPFVLATWLFLLARPRAA